jgi:hypothetical protein
MTKWLERPFQSPQEILRKHAKRCPTCGDVEAVRYENIGGCADDWHKMAINDAEGWALAKQRVDLVERVMKLPYIKATRNASTGSERFICRDDLITLIHNYAKETRGK